MAFRLSHFLGDLFAMSTVTFGVLAWIVALAGAAASPQDSFPHFSWWCIVYEILVIIAIFLLYLNNTIELYKFTLVGLLSVAFMYTTNSTNNLIYNSDVSANLCCGAGCILLSILNLVWIVYFGGHPESATNQFIDSFSLKTHSHNHGHLAANDNEKLEEMDGFNRYPAPGDISHSNSNAKFQDANLRQSQLTTNNKSVNTPYMSSSQLNGLENFSSAEVHQGRDLTNNKRPTDYDDATSQANPVAQFRYKAKALYSYDANPDDINEISFVKDEILDVDDIDGKWWQARRSNGQVGICPSNYVKLLE